MSSTHHKFFSRRAFTLMEIMIVIIIIMILMGILVPTLNYAKRIANRRATESLMGNISTGIDAYYADFNMYPPSDPTPSTGNYNGANLGSGAEMLVECLTGYLDYGYDGAGPLHKSAAGTQDPAYGFRLLSGGQGKVYGPYVSPDPKTLRVISPTDQVFVDLWGNPILYYCAVPQRGRDVTQVFGTNATPFNAIFVTNHNQTVPGVTVPDPASVSNNTYFWQNMGCYSNTLGSAGASEMDVIVGRDSFLLISAGPPSGASTAPYFGKDSIVPARK